MLDAERARRNCAALFLQLLRVYADHRGITISQMCPYFQAKDLQVLTNSLHIVNALLQ
jgi:DeoR/GlpR family transcriptional regulator of sugar metabolism